MKFDGVRFGRYRVRISFRGMLWLQTQIPTTVKHFLCFWLLKEAIPTDVDKVPQFLPGTPLQHEGKLYRYWRAPKDMRKGEVVFAKKPEEVVNHE